LKKLTFIQLFFICISLYASPTMAQIRDYSVVVSDQKEYLIKSYGLINKKSCDTRAVGLHVQQLPAKGTFRVAEVEKIIPPGSPDCVGEKSIASGVYYTPKKSEIGIDKIRLLETGSGKLTERELIIWVKDPNKPNTMPPSRAEIEQLLGPVKTTVQLEEEGKTKLSSNISTEKLQNQQNSAPTQSSPKVVAFSVPLSSTGTYKANVNIGAFRSAGVIDTGASFVAIPYIVMLGQSSEIIKKAKSIKTLTAAGEREGFLIVLQEITVGPFTEKLVEAVVLPPEYDGPILIGQTFLSRLKTVKIQDGQLSMMR
jgi:clan AA aspartic protease (TIGR02281 family)